MRPQRIRHRSLDIAHSVGEVDWTYRAGYMRERHGIEADWAREALEDPGADRSGSGQSVQP
nr:hypothetical protein GCM10017611_05480 [Rhodococcus wratislaviensis]